MSELSPDREIVRGRSIGDDGGGTRRPRTRVCAKAGSEFGFHGQIDGAWYRCCNGHIRKLVDCCGYTRYRINGDYALTGYCYSGRHVFCVMYYDTKIKC